MIMAPGASKPATSRMNFAVSQRGEAASIAELSRGRGRRSGDFALLLRLQTQLSARGIDVVSLFASERDGNTRRSQHVGKAFLPRDAWSLPRQTFHGVVRNQI